MFLLPSLLVFCVLFQCVVCNDAQCALPRPNSFTFSINSVRNLTGHWTAQLEHGASRKDVGPWVADIEHTTTTCEDSESIHIVATVTAPPQRPGGDYELIPKLGYYKFHTSGKNWREARQICEQEGAHLLILNSEEEAGVIRSFWRRHPKLFDGWRNSCAYIGIHDEFVEGEYITLFGESLNATGYARWAKNEPGEGTSGNSGCVGRDGALYDTNGFNHLAFFCEQEL
ncbi:hemolymph lipopolysaccharide-binding protein-like isoform X2 [Zootermopsis nevadensis]|uniref:hemolymph lipopolysaccharide-binding protein-like isoform X2 n=1 Tax=Zootermopsis nevadensis TaxID=136037 RepID=UPI000B8E85EF|nr:hemolymph lipopolysaccharide-binding protein-like isoform X2 [Zootermopsis nevadensis]